MSILYTTTANTTTTTTTTTTTNNNNNNNKHKPESLLENETRKILWNYEIETDPGQETRPREKKKQNKK